MPARAPDGESGPVACFSRAGPCPGLGLVADAADAAHLAGGTAEMRARRLGQPLIQASGQMAMVDDRSGAGGIIGSREFLRQPADGQAILLGRRPSPIRSIATCTARPRALRLSRAARVEQIGHISLWGTHSQLSSFVVSEMSQRESLQIDVT